jgi:hypothetical protein
LSRVDLEIVERVLDRHGRGDLHASTAAAVTPGASRSGEREANQKESRNGCAAIEIEMQNHHPRLTRHRLPGQFTTRKNDDVSFLFCKPRRRPAMLSFLRTLSVARCES